MCLFTPASRSQEILFGPLTGIEVLNVRVDGSIIIIEGAFSINLTSLTLEQVLGKRLGEGSFGAVYEASWRGGSPRISYSTWTPST